MRNKASKVRKKPTNPLQKSLNHFFRLAHKIVAMPEEIHARELDQINRLLGSHIVSMLNRPRISKEEEESIILKINSIKTMELEANDDATFKAGIQNRIQIFKNYCNDSKLLGEALKKDAYLICDAAIIMSSMDEDERFLSFIIAKCHEYKINLSVNAHLSYIAPFSLAYNQAKSGKLMPLKVMLQLADEAFMDEVSISAVLWLQVPNCNEIAPYLLKSTKFKQQLCDVQDEGFSLLLHTNSIELLTYFVENSTYFNKFEDIALLNFLPVAIKCAYSGSTGFLLKVLNKLNNLPPDTQITHTEVHQYCSELAQFYHHPLATPELKNLIENVLTKIGYKDLLEKVEFKQLADLRAFNLSCLRNRTNQSNVNTMINGASLLHHAVAILPDNEPLSLEILQLLIRAKANLQVKDENGMTPLVCAVTMDKPNIVGLLLDNGANMSEKIHLEGDNLYIEEDNIFNYYINRFKRLKNIEFSPFMFKVLHIHHPEFGNTFNDKKHPIYRAIRSAVDEVKVDEARFIAASQELLTIGDNLSALLPKDIISNIMYEAITPHYKSMTQVRKDIEVEAKRYTQNKSIPKA